MTRTTAVWQEFVLLAAVSLLRIVCVFRYRIDSDEPQHLHVIWGWTRGFVQYRDIFDNHVPLFHILAAPIFGLLPESASILTMMRLALLPLGFATIALTGLLASRLYGSRAGVWAAILASVFPPFLLKTLETRNDGLWCVLILGALLALQGPPTFRRAVVVGLLTGLAAATSVKTAVIALAVALAMLTIRLERGRPRLKLRELTAPIVAVCAGLVPPAIIAAYFWQLGALDNLVYGAFGFNLQYDVSPARRLAGLIALPILSILVIWIARNRASRSPANRFLTLTIIYFVIVLLSIWPIITTRDFLPVFPLAVILFAAFFSRPAPEGVPPWRPQIRLVGLTVLGIVYTVDFGDLWMTPSAYPRQVIAETLQLTAPTDYVLDLKGETIYRQRPTRIILEVVGRSLIKEGDLRDQIAADVQRNGCCVAVRDSNAFPPATRKFLLDHFVSAGVLRVCGRKLGNAQPGAHVTFEIAVPNLYVIETAHGQPQGLLDGTPYNGPRRLGIGAHTFVPTVPLSDATVLWAGVRQRDDKLTASLDSPRSIPVQ
ncbi:MAG: hypothetical protein M3P06_07840 [Acidobacteriota bacterium]|nr:hypothetical protein [Acidobacteriota bacterium]